MPVAHAASLLLHEDITFHIQIFLTHIQPVCEEDLAEQQIVPLLSGGLLLFPVLHIQYSPTGRAALPAKSKRLSSLNSRLNNTFLL